MATVGADTTTAVTGPGSPPCPYRGLMPYTEDDAAFFFGRDQDSRLIVDNLRAYPLSVLYGPSGVGKSSVLRAGVMRLIREETERKRERFGVVENAAAYCSFWRDDPLRTLPGVLRSAVATATGVEPDFRLDRLDGTQVARWSAEHGVDLLIILDQFEEYFLYHEGEGDSFARELANLLQPGSRASVLIAIREDALAKLDSFEAAIPGMFDKTLRLEHLDRESAREAVVEPLNRYNEDVDERRRRSVEPELVESLLDQVEAGRVRVSTAAGPEHEVTEGDTGGRIEAPFLQLVLTRLWEEEAAAGSPVLRLQTLQDLGGAESIVREHLDRVVAAFDGADIAVLADVFGHLVTPGGTKIAHTASDLAELAGADPGAVRRVLQRLCRGDQRILREVHPPGDAPGAESRFEVFHDVLALAVLDWRRRWLAERREEQAHQDLVAQKEQAEAHARETRRRLRRARLAVGSLALLLVACLVLALLAWTKTREAERAEDLAVQRAQLADVERDLSDNPTAALETALKAFQRDDDNAAEEALRRSFDAADTGLVLDTGDEPVSAAVFTEGGLRIVTTSQDGHIRLWDASTGDMLEDIDAGRVAGTRRLGTPQLVGDVAVVGTFTGKAVAAPLDGSPPRVLTTPAMAGQVDVSVPRTGEGTQALTVSYDRTGAQLWDVRTGELVRRLGEPGERLTAAAIDDTGRFVATASSESGYVHVWDTSVRRFVASAWWSDLGLLRFVPGRSGVLVAADYDLVRPVVWRWRVPSGSWDYFGERFHQYAINGIDFDDAGRRVVVSGDKSTFVQDLSDGSLLNSGDDARDWVVKAVLSPDGRLVASATNDGEVHLNYADRRNNRPLRVFRGHGAAVNDVRFSSDGDRLLTAGGDGTVRVWRIPQRTVAWGGAWEGWLLAAEFSADGREFVVGSVAGDVRFVDAASGEVKVRKVAVGAGEMQSVDLSPDGRSAVVGGLYRTTPLVVRRGAGRSPRYRALEDSAYYLTRVRWSPSGQPLLVAGDYNNQVVAWDAAKGRRPVWHKRLGNEGSAVMDVDFSPDGTVLAAVSGDSRLTVLDPSNGEIVRTIRVGPTADIAVSTDGRYAATAGEDQTVRIWDLESNRDTPVREFTEPSGTIAEVTFSHDAESTWVAAVGADGVTHVWDRESGMLRAALRRHGDAVNAVDFDPNDRTRLLTASDDGTAAIYRCTPCDLDGEALEDAAEDRLPVERDKSFVGMRALGS
jgi:WD40 repeat protein